MRPQTMPSGGQNGVCCRRAIPPAVRFCLGFAALILWCGNTSAGKVETLDHQTFEGRISIQDNGRLLIVATNGTQHRLAFDQLRVARLNPAPGDACQLPRGWRVENLGGVQGCSVATGQVFRLYLTNGLAKEPKHQAGHFAYRVVRSDLEMAVRIREVSGAKSCLAGLMLRENLEPSGGFALLGVTPENRLRLETREGTGHSLRQQDLGVVTLPLWVKLSRQEKDRAVAAFRSGDGSKWQNIGQSRLSCRTEPFPDDSDNWRPKLFAGAGVVAATTGAVASASFDLPALTATGLMGEYFGGEQFRHLRFARLDRRIEFWWGDGPPAPEMEADHFSIRWTGQVIPKYSEPYRFHFEADDAAQLWVNGRELPRARFQAKPAREDKVIELPLTAGQKCDVKLEFQDAEGSASVRLGWSSRSQKLEAISPAQLTYTYQPDSPDEETAGTITNVFSTRGIWLCHGSFIAGNILGADDTATQVAFAGQKSFSILNHKIARVIFRTLRRPLPFEAALNRTGLFIKGGDFLESQFAGVNGRTLIVNSLLFGRRTFGLENSEALALVLNNYTPQRAPLELSLRDGSVLRIRQVRTAEGGLRVEDLTLGPLTIPEDEVIEFRNPAAGPVHVANQP